MKRILQALDGVSTTPVVGANDMAQFLRVVKEADNPPVMTGRYSDIGSKSGKPYDYQMNALQTLLTTESEPWKQNLTKWRIKNLETYGVTAFHTDYNKNAGGISTPIKVLDSESWLKKNPSLAKRLPPKCLPPVPQAAPVQQPGIIDKVKKAWNDWTPAYKKAADDLERSREEQGLGNFGGATGRFNQNESDNSYDMTKFLSIVNKNNVGLLMEGTPHKVSLPVQMAMQHYQQPADPKQEKTPSLFSKYYMQAEAEVAQEKSQKRHLINQYASMIAERVLMKEGKAVKQRLDPKCWTGKHKEGTKIKGGVRVNNCVPNESVEEGFGQQIAKKILMVARHYFQTHGTPEAELIQQGFKKDFNGNWFMPQYNTSGSGFDRKWSDARRMYGDPQTQKMNQQQVYGSLPEEYSTDDLSHNKMGAGPGLQSNEPVEEMAKEKQPPKPRNFVAKNMVNTGTQVHKDRKRAEKNGDNKHKKAIPAYESVLDEIAKDPCWDKYKMLGTKKKNGKTVPNCVKK